MELIFTFYSFIVDFLNEVMKFIVFIFSYITLITPKFSRIDRKPRRGGLKCIHVYKKKNRKRERNVFLPKCFQHLWCISSLSVIYIYMCECAVTSWSCSQNKSLKTLRSAAPFTLQRPVKKSPLIYIYIYFFLFCVTWLSSKIFRARFSFRKVKRRYLNCVL